ncbi:MAG: hypothetical protein OEZ68_04215 [Gammaproteobacteria bacterium]|nr:hypothetical protein [Gammaproteobacteria bacterium]MDH5799992.1 hypothetical protein [Gammaproteobacteria bacterium]
MEIANTVLDQLKESDLGKQLQSDYESKRIEKRRQIQIEIDKQQKEHVADGVRLNEKRRQIQKRIDDAKQKLLQIERERLQVDSELMQLTRYELKVSRLKAELANSIPQSDKEKLTAFISDMRELSDKNRRSFATGSHTVKTLGGHKKKIYSNAEECDARDEAIRHAIRQAEEVRYSVDTDISAFLDNLRESVPKL